MTMTLPVKIKCGECGNLVDMTLYDSVNVKMDPELKEKVVRRELNVFNCLKCGFKEGDLGYPFLYIDSDKKIWVWCYPKQKKKDREAIEKEVRDKYPDFMAQFDIKTMFAFGYDELLSLIK